MAQVMVLTGCRAFSIICAGMFPAAASPVLLHGVLSGEGAGWYFFLQEYHSFKWNT